MSLINFGTSTAPIGAPQWVLKDNVSTALSTKYLMLDGSEVSKTEYADLYAIYRDSYGTATDPNKFVLPKLTNGPDYEGRPEFLFSGDNAGNIYKIYTEDGGDGQTAMTAVGDENVFKGHNDAVYEISISSADGKFIYTGSDSGSLYKVDTATMTIALNPNDNSELKFTGHGTNRVDGLAISPDGNFLYSGGHDNKVFKIDTETMTQATESDGVTLIPAFEGQTFAVWVLALSSDGSFLYSGGGGNKVFKIDTTTMTQATESDEVTLIPAFEGHTISVNTLAISSDGNFLYSGGADDKVFKIDTVTMTQATESDGVTLIPAFEGHTDLVLALALSSDGSTLYSGGFDNKVFKIDTTTMTQATESDGVTLIPAFEGHTGNIFALALSSDGSTLYSGGASDNKVFKIDTTTMTAVKDINNNDLIFEGHTGTIYALALSPDGTLLYSGGDDGKVFKITTSDMTQADPESEDGVFVANSNSIIAVVVSPDGTFLYSGGRDNKVRKINVADMSPVLADPADSNSALVFEGHTDVVGELALSSDGNFLYSGADDAKVFKIDTETMTQATESDEVTLIPAFEGVGRVFALALSSDGNFLYMGGEDKKVFKIDTETMTQATESDGVTLIPAFDGTDWIRVLSLSSDGNFLYSGEDDKVFKINTDTMTRATESDGVTLIPAFEGHTSIVRAFAISSDGNLLYSGGSDSKVFKIDTTSMAQATASDDVTLIPAFDGHTGEVIELSVSSDGSTLYSGGNDNKVFKIDTATMTQVDEFDGHASGITALAFLEGIMGTGISYSVYPMVLAK